MRSRCRNGNTTLALSTRPPTTTPTSKATSTLTQASATYLVTSLTPGSHSFTAKYKISGGTQAQFQYRSVIVIPQ